jgi:Na+-transporting NADH:ubiquinone oxidoreductase subunit F
VSQAGEDKVTILVDGQTVTCDRGRPLLNAILNAGLVVETACGGKGTCHLCRVTIVRGAEGLVPPNAVEKRALGNVLLAQGMRLSCQVSVESSFEVKLPRYETAAERRERIRRARERKGDKGAG